MRSGTRIHWFGVAAVTFLAVGTYYGLFVAPPERHMGDVQRIMYVHVPSAWVAMVCYTFAFGAALVSLWSHGQRSDSLMTAAIETGAVLNGLLLIQGSLWGRATWGVWWDWDVRLTTSLVLFFLFAGVLALRAVVDSPERRATWSAVATVVAYVDVPLVYFCVRWWRSLHQVQSSPNTVDPAMVLPLRLNSFGMLFLAIWLIALRSRLETARRTAEEAGEPEKAPVEELPSHA